MKNKNVFIKRILAIMIDIYMITLLLMGIGFVNDIFHINIDNLFIFIFGFGLFILKDFYSVNGSLGKKIMKTRLMFDNDKNIIIKKIIRNSLIIVWPIEMLVLLIYKKRIGDYITTSKIQLES